MKEFKNEKNEAYSPMYGNRVAADETKVESSEITDFEMDEVDWDSQKVDGVSVVDNVVKQINEYIEEWYDLDEEERGDCLTFTFGDILKDLEIDFSTVLDDPDIEDSVDEEWKDWRYYTIMTALDKFEESGWSIEVNDENTMSPKEIYAVLSRILRSFKWWNQIVPLVSNANIIEEKKDIIFNRLMQEITKSIQVVMSPEVEEDEDDEYDEDCFEECTKCDRCGGKNCNCKCNHHCDVDNKIRTESKVSNPQKEVPLNNNTAFQKLMDEVFGFKF